MERLIYFALLFFSVKSPAQNPAQDFLKNKLYIIETQKPYFDSALKAVMSSSWTASEIGGFITPSEYKALISPQNSFVEATIDSWLVRSASNVRQRSGIFFYRGTNSASLALNVSFFGGFIDESYDSVVYKLELMIRTVMNELVYFNSMDSVRNIYNLSLLKSKKTLLINTKYFVKHRRSLTPFEEDAFSKYPYKIEYANSEQIAAYIKAKDERYVLAVPVANDASRQVQLFDVRTGFSIGSFSRKGLRPYPVRPKDVENFVEKIDEYK